MDWTALNRRIWADYLRERLSGELRAARAGDRRRHMSEAFRYARLLTQYGESLRHDA